MIVVAISALYAIALDEPDLARFAAAIDRSERAIIGAPTAFELRLVVGNRHGPAGLALVDDLLARPPLEIGPWTAEHVPIAQDALLRFGGRPARLNFGDCMSYALARSLDAPLLFKGDDFRHTDIRAAL